MLAAVQEGDAKKLADLMRQDPSFNVNQQDEDGYTLLHYACLGDSKSPVIPLLLAHPDIDVNAKTKDGSTPFYYACYYGSTYGVREMLNDSRVKVNEPDNYGWTPLWWAARDGRLDVIRWWIASGREIDLGTLGNINKADIIGVAKRYSKTEVVDLLESFKSDAAKTRHSTRVELGMLDALAAEMFAMVVFVSDGLLSVRQGNQVARFFSISKDLPLELQMILCYHAVGSAKEIIRGEFSESAFKELAKRF